MDTAEAIKQRHVDLNLAAFHEQLGFASVVRRANRRPRSQRHKVTSTDIFKECRQARRCAQQAHARRAIFMNSLLLKKLLTFLFIATLTASAFFIRLENLPRPKLRTIDEFVYLNLGRQLTYNLMDYNSIRYGQHLQKKGRAVRTTFFSRCLSIPRCSPYLEAGFIRAFGDNFLAAGLSLSFSESCSSRSPIFWP